MTADNGMRGTTPVVALLAAILCWGSAAVADVVPHIWATTNPNHPGAAVQIYGRDFGPKETIDIYFDKTDEVQVVTWKSGGFGKVPLIIPANALPGRHRITAVGRTSGDTAKKLFVVRTDWPVFGFTADGARYNPYENLINAGNVSSLSPLWVGQTGNVIASSPAVANGAVYVGSDDGKLYAFDAMTGATKWTGVTGGTVFSSPAVANGIVYVGSSDGKVYAFDAATGGPRWSATTGGEVIAPLAVANGAVYAPSDDGRLYAFDALTGGPLWITDPSQSPVRTFPVIADGAIWVGWDLSQPPIFNYFLQGFGADGQFGAEAACQHSSPVTSPAAGNGWLYFGEQSGAFCGVNPSTGEFWSATIRGVQAPPALANGTVYVSTANSTLYAVDAVTGAARWVAGIGSQSASAPAVANGVVYTGSLDGNLHAFDAAGGAPLWMGTTGGAIVTSPVVANGVVYVSSEDGKLYAFALNGGHAPVYHRDSAAPSPADLLANRKAIAKPH